MNSNVISIMNVELLSKAGMQYYDKKDYVNAHRIFSRILKIESNHFESHFYLSAIYEIIGEYEKAILEFEKLIKLRGEDNDLKEFLLNLYIKRSKYRKAIALFRQLLTIDNYSFKYWETLIDILIKANKLIFFLNKTKIITKYPSITNDVLLRSMILYRDSDQLNIALLISEILLKLDYSNPINHYFIGTVYEAMNDTEKLKNEFKITSKLLKNNNIKGNILYEEIFKRLKELGIN